MGIDAQRAHAAIAASFTLLGFTAKTSTPVTHRACVFPLARALLQPSAAGAPRRRRAPRRAPASGAARVRNRQVGAAGPHPRARACEHSARVGEAATRATRARRAASSPFPSVRPRATVKTVGSQRVGHRRPATVDRRPQPVRRRASNYRAAAACALRAISALALRSDSGERRGKQRVVARVELPHFAGLVAHEGDQLARGEAGDRALRVGRRRRRRRLVRVRRRAPHEIRRTGIHGNYGSRAGSLPPAHARGRSLRAAGLGAARARVRV